MRRLTGLLDLFNRPFESLLSLFLEDVTVPAFPRHRVLPALGTGKNKARGGLNGLIVRHPIEGEVGPECADGVKNRQGAFVFRIEGG